MGSRWALLESVFPLTCKYCKRTFSELSMLRSHVIRHQKRANTFRHCYLRESISDPRNKYLDEESRRISFRRGLKGFGDSRDQQDQLKTTEAGLKQRSLACHKPDSGHSKTARCEKKCSRKKLNYSNKKTEGVTRKERTSGNGSFKTDTAHKGRKKKVKKTKKKTHFCKFCQRQFGSTSDLGRHEMTHTNERPYKCRYCPSAFTRKDHQTRHENLHSNVPATKTNKTKPADDINSNMSNRFKCRYCDKHYSQDHYRNAHEKIHKSEGYKCESCEKVFPIQYQKERHELVHSGEKPHSCRYCSRRFAFARDVINHELTHTDTRPFACQYCAKRFYRDNTRKRHEQTHTRKKFSCEHCKKQFSRADYRNIHQRTCQN
ncbi:uncharacterized protein [Amphiura filiformis]|uniref:uncharacterized protein n=1 Tax=Amphiura filiformis TaxID=82378 RepID=UPI003B20E067